MYKLSTNDTESVVYQHHHLLRALFCERKAARYAAHHFHYTQFVIVHVREGTLASCAAQLPKGVCVKFPEVRLINRRPLRTVVKSAKQGIAKVDEGGVGGETSTVDLWMVQVCDEVCSRTAAQFVHKWARIIRVSMHHIVMQLLHAGKDLRANRWSIAFRMSRTKKNEPTRNRKDMQGSTKIDESEEGNSTVWE